MKKKPVHVTPKKKAHHGASIPKPVKKVEEPKEEPVTQPVPEPTPEPTPVPQPSPAQQMRHIIEHM